MGADGRVMAVPHGRVPDPPATFSAGNMGTCGGHVFGNADRMARGERRMRPALQDAGRTKDRGEVP